MQVSLDKMYIEAIDTLYKNEFNITEYSSIYIIYPTYETAKDVLYEYPTSIIIINEHHTIDYERYNTFYLMKDNDYTTAGENKSKLFSSIDSFEGYKYLIQENKEVEKNRVLYNTLSIYIINKEMKESLKYLKDKYERLKEFVFHGKDINN